MRAIITINGVTKEIELTKEQIKHFIQYGMVEKGEYYFYIQDNGRIGHSREANDMIDDERFYSGNYFLTANQAEKAAKLTSLRLRMQRFSDEHGGDNEWGNKNKHWYIVFDSSNNKLKVEYTSYHKRPFEVYFPTEEVTEKALEIFKEDLEDVVL